MSPVETWKCGASLEREIINIFDGKEVKEYYVKLKILQTHQVINSINKSFPTGVTGSESSPKIYVMFWVTSFSTFAGL